MTFRRANRESAPLHSCCAPLTLNCWFCIAVLLAGPFFACLNSGQTKHVVLWDLRWTSIFVIKLTSFVQSQARVRLRLCGHNTHSPGRQGDLCHWALGFVLRSALEPLNTELCCSSLTLLHERAILRFAPLCFCTFSTDDVTQLLIVIVTDFSSYWLAHLCLHRNAGTDPRVCSGKGCLYHPDCVQVSKEDLIWLLITLQPAHCLGQKCAIKTSFSPIKILIVSLHYSLRNYS